MLLKYFYDQALAHASYMVGCQKTGEAIIVDPGRDVEQYLAAAAKESMTIVGIADTHIHADYVSGARELADRIGAKLYLSDEGPAEWKYEYAKNYDHRLLKDGDTFAAGKVEFKVLHTPGHTPESISFILTDKGGGANKPMGIFTGDFVFVGSIGRPDLLEEAAGIMGTAEPGRAICSGQFSCSMICPTICKSGRLTVPEVRVVKAWGAIPSSTVGYEKIFNPALQYTDEQEFVDYILSEQPEAPKYFAVMKRVNKEGPAILGEPKLPTKLAVDKLCDTVAREMVVDTSVTKKFAAAHVEGTINIQPKYLAMWGGSLLDYDEPVFLISGTRDLPEVVRILHKIGMDNLGGYFCEDEVADGGFDTEHIPQETPEQLADRIKSGEIELMDVRGLSERHEEMVPGSKHCFLGTMLSNLDQFQADKTYALLCRTGGRSIIGASLAERAGVKHVINLAGGIEAWKLAGMPIESSANELLNTSR